MGKVITVQAYRTQQALGYVRVTRVREQLLGTVTEDEARAEGYDSLEAFRKAWKERYGTFDPSEDVWVTEFKLIPESDLTPYEVRQYARNKESSRVRAAAQRSIGNTSGEG